MLTPVFVLVFVEGSVAVLWLVCVLCCVAVLFCAVLCCVAVLFCVPVL